MWIQMNKDVENIEIWIETAWTRKCFPSGNFYRGLRHEWLHSMGSLEGLPIVIEIRYGTGTDDHLGDKVWYCLFLRQEGVVGKVDTLERISTVGEWHSFAWSSRVDNSFSYWNHGTFHTLRQVWNSRTIWRLLCVGAWTRVSHYGT